MKTYEYVVKLNDGRFAVTESRKKGSFALLVRASQGSLTPWRIYDVYATENEARSAKATRKLLDIEMTPEQLDSGKDHYEDWEYRAVKPIYGHIVRAKENT